MHTTQRLRVAALAAVGMLLAGTPTAQRPTLNAGELRSARPTPWVLRCARALPIDREPIVDAGIVVQGARIVAVDRFADLPLAADTPVFDVGERIVYPGFVDLHHHVSDQGGDINDMVTPINAELRTLDAIRPTESQIYDTLAGGVTTTLFIPGSGTNISGFGVLMKMAHDRPLEELVVRELGAMKVAQGYNPERRHGDLGNGRMGMHDLLTRAMLRGKEYADAWRAFAAGKGPKPELQADLEQLRKVFDHEVPVIIHTAGARDCIATARMFGDVFQVDYVLSHGTFNGHWAASALAAKGTPVNLGPRMFDFDQGRVQGIAAGYYDVGCTNLSINTDAPVIAPEQLPLQAAMAVRLGLPWEAGLKAITLVPAQQIGIADRVGSITAGKDADLVVGSGDPLDPRFPPEMVFLEGRLAHTLDQLR